MKGTGLCLYWSVRALIGIGLLWCLTAVWEGGDIRWQGMVMACMDGEFLATSTELLVMCGELLKSPVYLGPPCSG